jgi:predicted AlkP superfamily phosphohydrolase/phosphomutase/tetratricopeptide (TPR) repeat protein
MNPKVLVIGWDSADWKIINPLMDAGEMPALQSLVENGVCGNIATLDPPLSPMLWTSIATGMRPHKHGILGFLEPDASGKNLRQTHITSRKVKAIWNILNQEGKKSNVIGWWPSHPAEPINGTMISNFFQTANFADEWNNWDLKEGCVHPSTMHETFAELRVHPTELTEAHIIPFIPDAAKINQNKDKSLIQLTKNLAEAASVHNCLTYLLENDKDWDFTAVYYEAPDLIAHNFMKYHPPKMDHIPQEKFDLYKDVINGIYKFHDMMLDRTLQLIDEHTTVILVSDHGFHSDHLRPKSLPKEPAAIALEHSPYGVFIAKGPSIKKDERIFGASVLDITPTLLTLFGLPVGADMDGKPLVQIFEENKQPTLIPSWEFVDGNSGQHPKEFKADIYEVHDEKALQQLADLGYIEQPGESNNDENFKNNIKENQFYLARSYFNAKEYPQAIEILEELVKDKPAKERFVRYLMECYLNLNNTKRCRELLDELKADIALKAAEKEKKKKGSTDTFGLLMLEGAILINDNKYKEAIRCFEKADSLSKDALYSKMALGNAYMQAKRWNDAIRIFENEIKYDSNSSHAFFGLGRCYYEVADYDNSIDAYLDSIGLLYFNPNAHYHLAESFFANGMYEEAAQAYEMALRLAPKMGIARLKLEKVYRDYLKDNDRYEKIMSEDIYKDAEEIIIVSGLPRSGTSMMMQLLEAGGLPVFTDNLRIADENNKKGYYEHEAVKIIHKDNSWMKNAVGKTVKVVSHLLTSLPMRYKYKIVFMERDLDEVTVSQSKMLQNLGKLAPDTAHFSIEQSFRKTNDKVKTWLNDKQNMNVIYIDYKEAITNSENVIEQLNEFFDNKLNTQHMQQIIDKNMYRTQK